MARRYTTNERAPSHRPEEEPLPRRWTAPTLHTRQPPNHAGPSNQPFDSREISAYGWNVHPPRSLGTTAPSDTWTSSGRDAPRPSDEFAHTHLAGGMPIAAATSYNAGPAFTATAPLMAPPASLLHSQRTSAEGWQTYENGHTIPRNAPPPLLVPAPLHAPASCEPLPHLDAPQVTSPVSSRLPHLAAPAGDLDPPRARVACSFCRVRKLRCDGATPCRHCERRSIDCVYAPNKNKVKSSVRGSSGPDKGSNVLDQVEPGKAQSLNNAQDSVDAHERGTKRGELSTPSEADHGFYNTSSTRGRESSKRLKTLSDHTGRFFWNGRTEHGHDLNLRSDSMSSSSKPGSDLAMIQNNDTTIPMELTSAGQDDWWNHTLSVFGRSRSKSTRVVKHLLTRFVRSNAVFFGLLHAPTLLSVVSRSRSRDRADPALYLAVLAVSACDLHQSRVSDERTADMRSSNGASRRLALRLSEMAASYLQTSTAHGSALSPSLGQAASILALTQPDGSAEQDNLIRLAETVVRTLKLHEAVSSREPLLQESEPESPTYWSRPLTSDCPESEIKYESIVRLCWTGISHRFRKYIAKPDEDFGTEDLPDFVHDIRPMAYWQPSLLPKYLPPAFFHSQDLMRRSARLSRLTVSLAKLDKVKEVDGNGMPSPKLLEQVRGLLRSLDELESAFARHRPRSDPKSHEVLARTLQMFCRMHVWVRLNIWRKYRLWTFPKATTLDASLGPASDRTNSASLSQQHHPTVQFWLDMMNGTIKTMQQDFEAHVFGQSILHTSVADIDALARTVVCALDLAEASGNARPLVSLVDAALGILKRVVAYTALNQGSHGLQVEEDVKEKIRAAGLRHRALQSNGAPAPGRLDVDVAMDERLARADTFSDRPSPVPPLSFELEVMSPTG